MTPFGAVVAGAAAALAFVVIASFALLFIKRPWTRTATIDAPLEEDQSRSDRQTPKALGEDYDRAALTVLLGRLRRVNKATVELGYASQEDIDANRAALAAFRNWARDAEMPDLARAGYMHWLHVFERDCDEAQSALDAGLREKRKAESEQFWDDIRQNSVRADALNIPRPPR